MTNLAVLIVVGLAVLLGGSLVAWRHIHMRRHPPLTEYQQQMAAVAQGLVTLRLEIVDNFTPKIREAAKAIDRFGAAWAKPMAASADDVESRSGAVGE